MARRNTTDNSSFPIWIIIGLIPPRQHFPFSLYFYEFLSAIKFLVWFDPVHSRNHSWNSTLGIHKLLRLSYFGEFRPGEIRLNSFLGTEPTAEYICFQKYKNVGQISNSRLVSFKPWKKECNGVYPSVITNLCNPCNTEFEPIRCSMRCIDEDYVSRLVRRFDFLEQRKNVSYES